MPNSELQSKTYSVPDKVYNRVRSMLSKMNVEDGQARGLKRAEDIVDDREVSYAQMKRLKNYFDNYSGDGSDDEYNLIGGKLTKQWVEDSLEQDRRSIKHEKKVKMDGGLENQFIKTHTKDKDNANPTNPDSGMIDVTSGSVMDKVMTGKEIYKSSNRKKESYEQEIESIKYLIEYMNK